uniref:Globin C, coelomic n=1 Tax=Hadrurus spadix TaxID=141984 RepID=A0A1W7RAG4_9SCOR
MGNWWSDLSVDSNMDVPDSKLGLTLREKEGIKIVWASVRKNMKGNGVEILVKFFTVYPDYQKLFRAFADVPLSELKQNKKLIAHATSVIYSLSSLVESLDDVENLKELTIKISESHLPRGVSKQQFAELGKVIVEFFEEKLGKLLTPAAKTGWEKLLGVVASIAGEVAEEKQGKK